MIQRNFTQDPPLPIGRAGRGPNQASPIPAPFLTFLVVVGGLLLLPLTAAPVARASSARGPILASIDQVDRSGLIRANFLLDRPTPVRIWSEGLGDPEGKAFLAQGWVLDLNTRQPVWTLAGAKRTWSEKSENWSADTEMVLPAGVYAAYFAAYGGPFPVDARIRIFGLELGRFQIDSGPVIRWDKEGTPERWGIKVQARDAGFVPLAVPDSLPRPYPTAELRLLGLQNSTVQRRAFDLDRPVEFRVHFTGEYARGLRDFADGAWITDRSTWRRVWMPDWEMTEPAGGADKNRRFEGTVRLPRGSYLLTAVTDQTHATGEWNMVPPWDPEAWGIAADPLDPNQRSDVRITSDGGLPRPQVSISAVPDNQFMKKAFSVERSVKVLLRAQGEDAGQGYTDFGWVERSTDLEPVWHMRGQDSYVAGGARKNRLVESVITLPKGDYSLCYVTDDSHSYGDWNDEQPWEPEAWGINLAVIGETKEAADAVLRAGPPKAPPFVVSLAPVGDDQNKVKRFDVSEKVEVLLVAVGEGVDGEMTDYAWLEQEKTGRRIWEMSYSQTEPAGGSKKNRMVRASLTLPPGGYALHFVTDDSHAFGDWNDLPPDQPELWGVTLIEVK